LEFIFAAKVKITWKLGINHGSVFSMG
jgi:hypothetical protein